MNKIIAKQKNITQITLWIQFSMSKKPYHLKQLLIAFIFCSLWSINGAAQDSMFYFQSELLGTWVSVDDQNRLGKSVVII